MLPCNPTPGNIPRKKQNSKRYTQPKVYCSTIYNSQDIKQPKHSSKEECIEKMWYTYIMEFYSAIKRKVIMPFA